MRQIVHFKFFDATFFCAAPSRCDHLPTTMKWAEGKVRLLEQVFAAGMISEFKYNRTWRLLSEHQWLQHCVEVKAHPKEKRFQMKQLL